MPPEQTVATAPQAPAQNQQATTTPAAQQTPDVVRNILNKQGGSNAPKDTSAPQEAPKVSVSMDDIKDPVARSILEKKLAEANAGISKTFGEIGAEKARLLKEREDALSELSRLRNKTYTPQDIQEMLQRQDFIQAAQAVQQQMAPQQWEGTAEDWSNLSESEKRQFQSVVAQQNNLTQQMGALLQSQIDTSLKTKYPDYDPKPVDDFIRRAESGRLSQEEIREAVHMYLNGPRYIKQAYEYAMQDKAINLQEKMNGSTLNGISTNLTDEKPVKLEGERSSAYVSRLMKWNLKKLSETRPQQ